MDRVERGGVIEAEPKSEEPFAPTSGFGDRREIAELLLVLVVVMVLAAATSVLLVPA